MCNLVGGVMTPPYEWFVTQTAIYPYPNQADGQKTKKYVDLPLFFGYNTLV